MHSRRRGPRSGILIASVLRPAWLRCRLAGTAPATVGLSPTAALRDLPCIVAIGSCTRIIIGVSAVGNTIAANGAALPGSTGRGRVAIAILIDIVSVCRTVISCAAIAFIGTGACS